MMQVSSSTAGRTCSGSESAGLLEPAAIFGRELLVLGGRVRQATPRSRTRSGRRTRPAGRRRRRGRGSSSGHRGGDRGRGAGRGAHVCPVDLTGVRRSSNTSATVSTPRARRGSRGSSAVMAATGTSGSLTIRSALSHARGHAEPSPPSHRCPRRRCDRGHLARRPRRARRPPSAVAPDRRPRGPSS